MEPRSRISLDGLWDFFLDEEGSLGLEQLGEQDLRPITVPAPWQAQFPELRHHTGAAWYQTEFDLPESRPGSRVILGFGAVDEQAEVWVNGQKMGEHTGGYLPFELDITPAVRPGQNRLTVRVQDPLETFPEAPHGKQSWYGLLSGIWQPVWLETRPETYFQDLRIAADGPAGTVSVELALSRPLEPGEQVTLEVLDPTGAPVAALQTADSVAELTVPGPQLWDLDTPALYTLRAVLPGDRPDELRRTFGFRTVETRAGQIWLNGRPIYLRGALDQDYYPEGISTPPSVEFIEDQFRKAKAMGLNCLRIHIKVGDPRYYEAADRLGLLVWTELPNWQYLTPQAEQRARETLRGIVARDHHHPSIIIWTLINESWGVDLTDPYQRAWLVQMYETLKGLDPTRLIVGNSACWGNYQVVTDILDFHNYYAIPDHYPKWKDWVANFASRPGWAFAHPYQDYAGWQRFSQNPWDRSADRPQAEEVRTTGQEPLVLSEFGNWGLPDVENLLEADGREPWWFETGLEWGDGMVYPHGIQQRFRAYHLDRVFPSLKALSAASQRLQFEALKYEIEQIRRHDSLAGYVITEFTDVHWECNGLLDMRRNPKAHFDRLGQINADDVILPEWERLSYWEGEPVHLYLSLSHYSALDLAGSRLAWQLEGFPELSGEIAVPAAPHAAVVPLGSVEFAAPRVPANTRAVLRLALLTAAGERAAETTQDLFFYTRASLPAVTARIAAPGLEEALSGLGLTLVGRLDQADLVVTRTMTDELRLHLLSGGRVLWLAETDDARQTYLGGFQVAPRAGRAWQGDWASSLIWICQDQVFQTLPVDGVADFALADLTPEHVLLGLGPHEFAHRVQAGIAVGWLHKAAALVAERPVGRGRLLASTFQLTPHLASHPAAVVLLLDLIRKALESPKA